MARPPPPTAARFDSGSRDDIKATHGRGDTTLRDGTCSGESQERQVSDQDEPRGPHPVEAGGPVSRRRGGAPSGWEAGSSPRLQPRTQNEPRFGPNTTSPTVAARTWLLENRTEACWPCLSAFSGKRPSQDSPLPRGSRSTDQATLGRCASCPQPDFSTRSRGCGRCPGVGGRPVSGQKWWAPGCVLDTAVSPMTRGRDARDEQRRDLA